MNKLLYNRGWREVEFFVDEEPVVPEINHIDGHEHRASGKAIELIEELIAENEKLKIENTRLKKVVAVYETAIIKKTDKEVQQMYKERLDYVPYADVEEEYHTY